MKRCLFKPFYLRQEYVGRSTEEKFAEYLDRQDCIVWWMKNGDTGKDWLSIRYFNEVTQKKIYSIRIGSIKRKMEPLAFGILRVVRPLQLLKPIIKQKSYSGI